MKYYTFFSSETHTFENQSSDRLASNLKHNIFRLTPPFYLSLLFITVFATYYSAIIYGGFILLDDMNLMNNLLNQPSFSLKDIIFPKTIGNYYRPVLSLSYRLDHLLWFDVASFWHMTNVVLHTANTGLVYLIARYLFSDGVSDKDAPACCASLLYGINPLATEAACWISGRSELLMAFFMLSSFYVYLLFRKHGRYAFLFFSGILFMCAAATKETALSLPGVIIVFEIIFRQTFLREKKRDFFLSGGYFLVLTMAYILFFRPAGINTSNMYISVGPSGLTYVSSYDNVLVLFASVGYYLKKLIIPWPLNFAIHSIPLIFYSIVGFSSLIFFTARWNYFLPIFQFSVAWVLITVSPAIAAAVLHLPWVPWAERYLYVPFAGFAIALGWLFATAYSRRPFLVFLAFSVVLCLFWATTLYRCSVWTDELRLWEDTAKKSDYGPVYYFLGLSLLNRNREIESIAQLKKAIDRGYRYDPYLTLSSIAFSKGDFYGSETWLKIAIQDFPERAELHKYLAENYVGMASGKLQQRFFLKAVDEYKKYVAMRKDDVRALLRIAELYRAAHREQLAVPVLMQVIEINDHPTMKVAKRYLQTIQKGESVR